MIKAGYSEFPTRCTGLTPWPARCACIPDRTATHTAAPIGLPPLAVHACVLSP